MDYQIALIIPNSSICNRAKKVLNSLGVEYPVYLASQQSAVEIGKKLENRGTKIIISNGITSQHLKNSLSISIFDLPFSGLEAATAIKEALAYSNRIVHVGTTSLFHYLSKSLSVLNFDTSFDVSDIGFCELNINKTIEEQTEQMIQEGYEVVIGGHVSTSVAQKLGRRGIEINVDEDVIKSCILTAQSITTEMIEKEEKNELYETMLQSMQNGIVTLNGNNIITSANNTALSIIGSDIINTDFYHALKSHNIIDINTVTAEQLSDTPMCTPIILHKEPILINNKTHGTVVTIQELSEINKKQPRSLNELRSKGFNADNHFYDIKGTGKSIIAIKEKALKYAPYKSSVLIVGETGTGKELFAQAIHNESYRKTGPFVSINCAALPANLIESELFGYDKGAFTGAGKSGKQGLFELADGGTIFLDEISEIPISIQSKLLRVIEEGDVIHVGGSKINVVDVRLICSSNKNLLQMVKDGKFKEDLYYRICVLEIQLPPLRERKEDIGELSLSLLKRFNALHNKKIFAFDPEVIRTLESLPLYGNVRELSNIIERMVIFADSDVINTEILNESLGSNRIDVDLAQPIPESIPIPVHENLKEDLKNIQKDVIIRTLEQCNNNKAAAARALGIDSSTLWRKLKKYGIKA